jgi:hypothetical protein
MKTNLILGSLLAFTGAALSQNNYIPGLSPSAGNIGINLPSAPTEYNMQVRGSIGIGYGNVLGVTNMGWPAAQAKILQTGWDATNSDYLVFYTPGAAGTQNTLEKMRLINNGNVGIGTPNPTAKLHAVGTTFAIKGDGGGNINDIGVQGNGYYGVDGNGSLVGVRGNCFGTGYVGTKIGVRGSANLGATNIGGYFATSGAAAGVTSYGVYSELFNANLGSTNYALYSTIGSNNLGAGPSYAGYFNGDVVTAGGFYFYSDGRIKKDIAKITNSMDLIKKLNPVNYYFNVDENKNLALPTQKQYGFISQEVQKILPEFTQTLIHPAKLDEEGKEVSPSKEVLGLNYNGFIALLTKGVQEQQDRIETLEKLVNDQKLLISELNNKVTTSTGINTLSNIEAGFTMSQNEPNPFTHETIVRYTLPQSVSSAFMAVYDLTGKQITTIPVTEKGTASITITSEKLAAGIYIYSIVADGKVIDSKRMIVAEK